MNNETTSDLEYRIHSERRRIFENLEHIRNSASSILESQGRVTESMHILLKDMEKKYMKLQK